jgi:hypothetical protein
MLQLFYRVSNLTPRYFFIIQPSTLKIFEIIKIVELLIPEGAFGPGRIATKWMWGFWHAIEIGFTGNACGRHPGDGPLPSGSDIPAPAWCGVTVR